MVNFNPYESRKLESLQPALRQGMDPMMAYEIFSGVESGALQRMAENRAMRQQMFADASDELRSSAAAGLPQGGAMDLVESYQAETPGLGRGKYEGRLEDLAGGLYEGPGKMSSLYQPEPGMGGPGGGAFDAETLNETVMEAAAMAEEAAQRQMAVRSAESGDTSGLATAAEITPGFTTLHDVRSSIMDRLRGMGVPDQFLSQIFDLVGQRFVEAGGDPGMASMGAYGSGGGGGEMPGAGPTMGGGGGGAPSYRPSTMGGSPRLEDLLAQYTRSYR